MKLRIRICERTSQVDVVGPESTLKELMEHIRDVLLPGHGLGSVCGRLLRPQICSDVCGKSCCGQHWLARPACLPACLLE